MASRERRTYRDKIYMIKDVIITLTEHGELNLTALVSLCGLNLKKHKHILDELESNGMISRTVQTVGKKTVTIYKPTVKGLEFCRDIIEPYEELFPRKLTSNDTKNK